MKGSTFFLLLIFLSTFFINIGDGSQNEIVIDKYNSEGYVAFIVNEPKEAEDDKDVISECDCKGTKKLTHGDGHQTPCPCMNSPNGCQCKKESGDNSGAIQEAPQKEQVDPVKINPIKVDYSTTSNGQIIMLTASWCPPCQATKSSLSAPSVKNSGWKVGSDIDNHIRFADVNSRLYQEMVSKYGLSRSIPQFLKIKNGQLISKKSGYIDAKTLTQWYLTNE